VIGRRSEIPTEVTQTGGGRLWRAIVGSGLVVGISYFLASVISSPSKRNIEALAGLIFLGILIIASPVAAYLFTLCLLPFPAHTSVASTSMMLIMALAAMVVIRARQEQLGSPFVSKSQDLALMGWGLMVVLSFYNQNPEAFQAARYLLTGLVTAVMLYYITIALLDSRDRLILSIKVSQVIAILLGVIAILQWTFPDRQVLPEFFSFSRIVAEREEIRRGEVRVMATFNGQELFAEYAAMAIMMQYFLMRWARGLAEKALWICGMITLLAAVAATATRGGAIILILGFGYVIAFGAHVVPRAHSMRVVFVAIALFYLALGLVEPLVSHLMDRMATIGADDSSVQSRTIVLWQALEAVTRQPFIGHGIATASGTFRGAVSINIHNLYLTLAYTIGIPGLLFFAWFLAGLWRKGRQVMNDRGVDPRSREIALALNVTLVMFMVDQLKIEYLRQPMAMHLAWLHFGFIMASWRIAGRKVASTLEIPS
jgi:O-antigen ligase